MQFILGGRQQGKTTLLHNIYNEQLKQKTTYAFAITTNEVNNEHYNLPSSITKIKLSQLEHFRKQLEQLKLQVGDVLKLQAELPKLSYDKQLDVIKKIENGKQKYPSCKIACQDTNILQVYQKCQIKYDGYLLTSYTITLLIDDIDRKFMVENDTLLDILYNMDEYRIAHVLITQSFIQQRQQQQINYLNVLNSLITSYYFLGGCDEDQFVELYQIMVTNEQRQDIRKIYQSLPKFNFITLRYNDVEFCIDI